MIKTSKSCTQAGFHRAGTSYLGEFWWDCSDTSTMFQTSTGTGAVSALNDPVGFVREKNLSGIDLAQPDDTSRRPLYKPDGIRTGKAGVQFDGLGTYFISQKAVVSQQNHTCAQPSTQYGVFRRTSANSRILISRLNGNTSFVCLFSFVNTGLLYSLNAGVLATAGTIDLNPHIFTIVANGGESYLYIDGVKIMDAVNIGHSSQAGWTIGASGASVGNHTNFFQGVLGEYRYRPWRDTQSEIDAMVASMQTKWGF